MMFPVKRPAHERHRALSLPASCPKGCTEVLLYADGFTSGLISELINSGLATTQTYRVGHAPSPIEITRVCITEAGRQALG